MSGLENTRSLGSQPDYERGYQTGFTEGYTQGREIGWAEGFQRGAQRVYEAVRRWYQNEVKLGYPGEIDEVRESLEDFLLSHRLTTAGAILEFLRIEHGITALELPSNTLRMIETCSDSIEQARIEALKKVIDESIRRGGFPPQFPNIQIFADIHVPQPD